MTTIRDEDRCSSIRNCDHERFIRTVGLETIEGLEYATVSLSGLTVIWKGLHGCSSMRNCTGRCDDHTYEVRVCDDGTFTWFKDGRFHREDGPAVVRSDGTQFWFKDDRLHREGGPAIVRSDGTQFWYNGDRLHREDGPALVWPDGTEERWFNGKRVG